MTPHAPTTLIAEPGTQNVLITRDFTATPEQLLRAHTEADLMRRWIGPRGYEMVVDVVEPRDGGRWRYLHRDGDAEYAFHGVFHGDPSVAGLVQSFEYEGMPGIVSVDSVTFEDLGDGRTRLHGRTVFPSVEARDGMVGAGMERGVSQGYEQLDELFVGGEL